MTDSSYTGPLLLGVVLLSVTLGAGMNWGLHHRDRSGEAMVRLTSIQADHALLAAQQSELLNLLADPQTVLINMVPPTAAQTSSAAAAWNPQRRAGMLLVHRLDPVPAGQVYQLWLLQDADAEVVAILSFTPGPAGQLVRFDLEHVIASPAELRVTLEHSPPPPQPGGPVLLQGRWQ